MRRLNLRNPLLATISAGIVWYGLYLYQTDPERTQPKDALASTAGSGTGTKSKKHAPKTFGFTSPWFKTLTLRSSEDVNHDTRRLRFNLPLEDAVSGLYPVSALLTKAYPNGSWIPTFRPYTPISDPANDRGYIDLLVKKYPDGKMSPHLHSLKPGDTHSFFGVPIPGGAGWPTGKGERNIALIAGGAGITPLYQFTQAVFRDAAIQRPQGRTFELPQITLIFGVNTPADLLFHDEFRDLEKRYPDHFRCVYTVTDPEGKKLPSVQDSLLIRNYETGRITRELLEKWMPKPDAPGGVKILLCGPPGMEEAIAGKKDIGGILGDMGYQKPQLARM